MSSYPSQSGEPDQGNGGRKKHVINDQHIVQVGDIPTLPAPEKKPQLQQRRANEWLDSVRRRMEEVRYQSAPTPPGTIFMVPKHLRSNMNLFEYEPQTISLGPYHRLPAKTMDCHKPRYLDDLLSRICLPTHEDNHLSTSITASHPIMKTEEEEEEEKQERSQLGDRTVEHLNWLASHILEKRPDALDRVQTCYLDPNDGDGDGETKKHLQMNVNRLMRMLILDACFVVEFMFKIGADADGNVGASSSSNTDDPMMQPTCSWWRQAIIMDMLLLENQIPFFIIRELLDLVMEARVERRTWLSLFVDLFEDYWPIPPIPVKFSRVSNSYALLGEPYHLLHLFRGFILPHLRFSDVDRHTLRARSGGGGGYQSSMLSASKLQRKAGIAFREFYAVAKKDGSALDIHSLTFHDGVIWMPPLTLYASCDTIFRNLIAFEQGHAASGLQVTSYVVLMHSLVRKTADVALLKRCGVLRDSPGVSGDLVGFFRDLIRGCKLQFNKGNLHTDVANHSKYSIGVTTYWISRWPAWLADLMDNYLKNPWTIIGIIVGTILLVLTVLQTIYTIRPAD